MEKAYIKGTDLLVSRLCFGGCAMGQHGWGNVSKDELIKAVAGAIDEGINFFDTADIYGLGESERTLALGLAGKRNKAIIATKFGVRIENGKTFYDNSKKHLIKSLDDSLKRLNTSYIDLYQIHYRDGITPLTEIIECLEMQKKAGKVRCFGLSNISISDLSEIKENNKYFVSFQNEYSLANRKNENSIIHFSSELNLTPMTWGSLGQGILSGKYDIDCSFSPDDRRSKEIYVNFHGEKLKKNLLIVEKLKKISFIAGKPISAVAIRFILDYLKNSVVIVGIKNIMQLKENMLSLNWSLDSGQIAQLNDVSKD